MKRILTAKEMSSADAFAIQSIGIPSMVLMERAALSVVEEILNRKKDISAILVVCGTGNNAGDGVAAARIFAERGIKSDILFVGDPKKRSGQLSDQINVLKYYGISEVSSVTPGKYSLIIDALFGIGLSRDISGDAENIIGQINAEKAYKVAVDIPSGISADTGKILGCAVKADLTVTFARAKAGHYLYHGGLYSGEVVVKEIGIPVREDKDGGHIYQIEKNDLASLPARNEFGNKATFGKLLVIGGSGKICGAAFFAACAALKSGIGMVRIFTSKENRTALSVLLPEALIDTYDDSGISVEELKKALDWADGVVIGPGLGTDRSSVELLENFCRINKLPAVIDADALNVISKNSNIWNEINFKTVVTPHIGEMCRLTGLSAAEIKEDPIRAASEYSKEHNTVCVLKDARTVTAYPDGRVFINTSGNSALATAGSGDVLSGILGGFAVRYKDCGFPIEAIGVYMHGLLGETAAGNSGKDAVTARDIISAMDVLQ